MFHLTFSPQLRPDARLTLSASGAQLTINGAVLDLSDLPEGATLPRSAVASDWLAGDIENRDGVLHLALILPHDAGAGTAAQFPQPLRVTVDGPIPLPTDPQPEIAE